MPFRQVRLPDLGIARFGLRENSLNLDLIGVNLLVSIDRCHAILNLSIQRGIRDPLGRLLVNLFQRRQIPLVDRPLQHLAKVAICLHHILPGLFDFCLIFGRQRF